jgi:hypothetical protein
MVIKMTTSIVRVELHDATYQHYEALHAHMERRGFSRLIKGNDGVWYRLPPAEYHYSGNATRDQLLAAAKESAASVRPGYAVLVTEYTGCSWQGLQAA